MTTPLFAGRIAQIALGVRDLPSATAFWRDVVGLTLMFEAPNVARVRDAGASVAREPHPVAPLGGGTLWMAFFRDPEGHLFALTSLR
jgi:catechol 2,3-dioxygenase-like lactoylglutathione lyase family enzyme